MLTVRRFAIVRWGGVIGAQGAWFNDECCAVEIGAKPAQLMTKLGALDSVHFGSWVWLDEEFSTEKPIYEENRLARYLGIGPLSPSSARFDPDLT